LRSGISGWCQLPAGSKTSLCAPSMISAEWPPDPLVFEIIVMSVTVGPPAGR
jgi:hypothetical protein